MFLFRKLSSLKSEQSSVPAAEPAEPAAQADTRVAPSGAPRDDSTHAQPPAAAPATFDGLKDEDRYDLVRWGDGRPIVSHPLPEQLGKISSGSFGLVHVARDIVTDEEVAIKLIPRGSTITKNVENEILILRRLNHFHTVKLKRVIVTQKYLGIVMEYCPRGDMYELVRRTANGFDEDTARWFFQQMVISVDYSHRLGVVHRDIKLKNMVLSEIDGRYLLKLCDFGFSKDHTRQSLAKTRLGTLEYMAPELLVRSSQATAYDGAKVDVWSLGVALFFMLTKSYPFEIVVKGEETREVAIMRAILTGPILLPGFVSEHCRDLLAHLLTKNPTNRFSIADIQQHPWYCHDLPRGAQVMNNNPLVYEPQPGLQSEDEIRQLCETARVAPGRKLTKIYSGLDEDRTVERDLEQQFDDVMEGISASLQRSQIA